MAKLSNLINTKINQESITIQGVSIPVIFTFKSFPYIEETYGKSYSVFEKELKAILKTGKVKLGKKEVKIMNSLIYAMIKSAGTDCTINEIETAIPISDLPGIFQVVLNIFGDHNFQISDMEKLKQEKK